MSDDVTYEPGFGRTQEPREDSLRDAIEGYLGQVHARTPTASPVPPLHMAESGSGGEA